METMHPHRPPAFNHLAHQQHLNLHEVRATALRQNLKDIEARVAAHAARPLLKKVFGPKTELDDPAFRTKLQSDAAKKLAFAEAELRRAEDTFQDEMHVHLSHTSDRYKTFLKAQALYGTLMEQASRYAELLRALLKSVGIARTAMAVSSNAAANTYSETAKTALATWLAAYAPVHTAEARLKALTDEYNGLVRGTPFSAVPMPDIKAINGKPVSDIGAIPYAEKRKLLEQQKELLDAVVPNLPDLAETIRASAADFEKALRDYRRKRHDEALAAFARG